MTKKQFDIETYYIKWVTTSQTDSMVICSNLVLERGQIEIHFLPHLQSKMYLVIMQCNDNNKPNRIFFNTLIFVSLYQEGDIYGVARSVQRQASQSYVFWQILRLWDDQQIHQSAGCWGCMKIHGQQRAQLAQEPVLLLLHICQLHTLIPK